MNVTTAPSRGSSLSAALAAAVVAPSSSSSPSHPNKSHNSHVPTTITTTSTVATTATTTTSSKKKFGQNLSKLTKPPAAPPVPGTGVKPNASSRNGLLLLSTKRASSSSSTSLAVAAAANTSVLSSPSIATTSTAAGGTSATGHPLATTGGSINTGILSSKHLSMNGSAAAGGSSATIISSSSSTQDALFYAVSGGRMEQQQQQPDAWRVASYTNAADKEQQQQDSLSHGQHQLPHQQQQNQSSETTIVTNGSRYHDDDTKVSPEHQNAPLESFSHAAMEHQPQNQSEYMAQLARERAEAKRREEEERFREQKERAGQRLRELEEKIMANKKAQQQPQHQPQYRQEMGQPQPPPPQLPMRTLFDPSSGTNVPFHMIPQSSNCEKIKAQQQQQRTISPSAKPSSEPTTIHPHALHRDNNNNNTVLHGQPTTTNTSTGPVIHLSSYEDRDRGERGTTTGPRMLFDPKSGAMVAVTAREENVSSAVTNHTGRGSNSSSNSSGGRNKERNNNNNNKRVTNHRNDRDSTGTTTLLLKKSSVEPTSLLSSLATAAAVDYDSSTNDNNNNSNKKRISRTRKDDLSIVPKGKGRNGTCCGDAYDNTPFKSTEVGSKNINKKKSNRHKKNTERILPRTCGVLYARDEKGTCYPVDGCEGDLGYGAYSVPGGPTKNPEAFAKLSDVVLKQQQKQYHNHRHGNSLKLYDDDEDIDGMLDNDHNEGDGYLDDTTNFYLRHPHGESTTIRETTTSTNAVRLQTGFQLTNEPTTPPPKMMDWVKPNERIELLTGMDDSPTLQATAREWAPSQAALAAAAKVAAVAGATAGKSTITRTSSSGAPSHDKSPPSSTSMAVEALPSKTAMAVVIDDEDDAMPFLGLGFDPTESMDSVIQSPSIRARKSDGTTESGNRGGGSGFDDVVDLVSLSLEPPFAAKTNRNIFAFGSSATWGSNGDDVNNSGWGDVVAGLGSNGGVANTILSTIFLNEGKDGVRQTGTTSSSITTTSNPTPPASFLSLTSAGSIEGWDRTGNTGILGFEDGKGTKITARTTGQ